MSLFRRSRHRPPTRECAQVAKVLQAYLDGEADDTTAAAVSAHLETCRHCGMEAQAFASLKESLRRSTAPDRATRTRLQEFAERVSAGEIEVGDQVD
ncbi:MAG TPA: zf-HC2 domain-containing protein [Acidimicrobiales bacterium]|nr:zf-HC2 domain-containing protein [Acidimicrobiales bacterium]